MNEYSPQIGQRPAAQSDAAACGDFVCDRVRVSLTFLNAGMSVGGGRLCGCDDDAAMSQNGSGAACIGDRANSMISDWARRAGVANGPAFDEDAQKWLPLRGSL